MLLWSFSVLEEHERLLWGIFPRYNYHSSHEREMIVALFLGCTFSPRYFIEVSVYFSVVNTSAKGAHLGITSR